MNEDDKIKIIAALKHQIELDDSIRVGYVTENYFNEKQPPHINDKIAARMEKLKYRKERSLSHPLDWNITKENRKWSERNREIYDFILIFSTAILSLLCGWLLQKSDKQNQVQVDKQQDSLIQAVSDSVKILEKRK